MSAILAFLMTGVISSSTRARRRFPAALGPGARHRLADSATIVLLLGPCPHHCRTALYTDG